MTVQPEVISKQFKSPDDFPFWLQLGRLARYAYNSTLMQLRVQIVRYIDEHFPGLVECELADASGRLHIFVEKGPVVRENRFRNQTS